MEAGDERQQEFLDSIFRSVDKNGDGEINSSELQSALSNGTWVPFNPTTVQIMINMFSARRSGTIGRNEFSLLWKYVTDWQQCFRSFDRDNSGFIDAGELTQAFQTFGFRLSPQVIDLLIIKFDRHKNNLLAFDDFIQCCIVLNAFTDAFRMLDGDRDGIITIGFEQFLALLLNFIST